MKEVSCAGLSAMGTAEHGNELERGQKADSALQDAVVRSVDPLGRETVQLSELLLMETITSTVFPESCRDNCRQELT